MHMIVQAAERNDAPRYALYTRFSSTLQDPRSIEDQLHLCRGRVAALGGAVVSIHADPSSSRTSMHDRPGPAILILGLRLIPLAPVMEYLVFRVQADV